MFSSLMGKIVCYICDTVYYICCVYLYESQVKKMELLMMQGLKKWGVHSSTIDQFAIDHQKRWLRRRRIQCRWRFIEE